MLIRFLNRTRVLGALGVLVCAVFLASCTTLGETRLATSIDAKNFAQVDALEARLAGLVVSPNILMRQNLEQDIRKLLEAGSYNAAYQARLWGLLSEIAWIFGDRPALEHAVREMAALNSAEPWLVIGRSRVAANPGDRRKILEAAIAADPDGASPYLYLESALVAWDEQRYRDAAAAFDRAFVTLPALWVDAYRAKRDRAYDLMNAGADSPINNTQELKWLGQEKVSVASLVGLTMLRTSFLDRFGKQNLAFMVELVRRLQQEGYLSSDPLRPDDPVTRLSLAQFLFHIVTIQENRSDSTTDKKIYTTSPIPDLPLDSPAFRAVILLVQREIMNLPDGVNFKPSDIALVKELVAALQKMNDAYR